MTDVATIFIRGICLLLMAAFVISGILFIVGETVEHFTPEACPPFDQCTPQGNWNAKNCKCWDSK